MGSGWEKDTQEALTEIRIFYFLEKKYLKQKCQNIQMFFVYLKYFLIFKIS